MSTQFKVGDKVINKYNKIDGGYSQKDIKETFECNIGKIVCKTRTFLMVEFKREGRLLHYNPVDERYNGYIKKNGRYYYCFSDCHMEERIDNINNLVLAYQWEDL